LNRKHKTHDKRRDSNQRKGFIPNPKTLPQEFVELLSAPEKLFEKTCSKAGDVSDFVEKNYIESEKRFHWRFVLFKGGTQEIGKT
jgi:hypothetical protein